MMVGHLGLRDAVDKDNSNEDINHHCEVSIVKIKHIKSVADVIEDHNLPSTQHLKFT